MKTAIERRIAVRYQLRDVIADTLSDTTYEYSVDGVQWRSITFIPSFKIKAGVGRCGGAQLDPSGNRCR